MIAVMYRYTDREYHWLLEEKYQGKKTPEFFGDLKRLQRGEPLAYIIGNIPFLGCTIDVSLRPLIPRVETEHWVHVFITQELSKSPKETLRVLDIFSGSGCIGISILKSSDNTIVDFGEINPRYVDQIKKNLTLNKISPHRYRIFESDVFASIPHELYDYILANPPYISRDTIDEVDQSVIDHEDHVALFAKNNGLFYIEKIISEASKFLTPGGLVSIEHGSDQKEAIVELLKKYRVESFVFLKDQYGKNRTVTFSYPQSKKGH